jgi:type VII secretion protein EccE
MTPVLVTEAERTCVAAGIASSGFLGWAAGGSLGGGVGLLVGLGLCVVPWWGQPLWVWAGLFGRRGKRRGTGCDLTDPVTVSNDGSTGGVRYQDDVAAAAIRVLGKAHQPSYLAGAITTANVIDLAALMPAMQQSMGLTIDSLSLVTLGARRRDNGDYPRVYDSLLGTTPYAGRRETWLIVRIRSRENAEALRFRTSAGAAALASAQRVAAGLRCRGIRARVASAEEILDLDRRSGRSALEAQSARGWHSIRDGDGWLTTYGYATGDLDSDVLEQVWLLRADSVLQNVTVFSGGTSSATVTLRSPQRPTASPSLRLRTLPGRQARAMAANLCGPRPNLRGLDRAATPPALVMPIGDSGVLLGTLPGGDSLLMPLADPGGSTRVYIAADEAVVNRIIVRLAAAGDRVMIHTNDFQRWAGVRMRGVTVSDDPRPDAGTTVSVLDGTLRAVVQIPRDGTVISTGPPGLAAPSGADVVIAQTGPATLRVSAAGQEHRVTMEFFRAENCFVTAGSRERVAV